ncbi:hypothetical protein [Flavobacterium fluviatile]|uniref:hypothetical protein n=1 Tax=Flavobacterium fluviatile TaxID=1862387 RepID=UPI0013D143A3|nr:hypothetical protein [Flavobacterium fluviatile]
MASLLIQNNFLNNPNDIEEIQVLKGNNATSLYGNQALKRNSNYKDKNHLIVQIHLMTTVS